MIGLTFEHQIDRVLCVGAHPDDIEIGALGLVARVADRHPGAVFDFVVLTGDEERRVEAEKSMRSLLGDRATLHQGSFADGMVPYEDPKGVKSFMREVAAGLQPQLVVAPYERDRHQDHAFVAGLVDQIYRDHLVLGYEIAKYDADLGRPQVFVPLSAGEAHSKVEHLLTHFVSQQAKYWYTEDAFRALMRLRGVEGRSQSGYAEAFHVSKLWLQ